MYPYNYKLGQKIQTDVDDVVCDKAFMAHHSVVPDAAAVDSVLAATALTSSTQEITENITNPDTPRYLQIKGNQAGVAGDVVITGTNYKDEAITETIALNGSTAVEGTKAFKTVTQIDLPVEVNVGTDTVSIGVIDKLGLPYLLEHDTVIAAHFDNVLKVPTVAVNSSNIESNTISFDGVTFDGVKQVDVYLIV